MVCDHKKIFFVISLIGFHLLLSGCSSLSGLSPTEKRQSIIQMKNEVLTELFKVKPSTRQQINNAPGYAVFSNANVNIIFASFGGGYGLVKQMNTGKHTYMKMGEVGLGLGAGIKDFRIVIVFHTQKAMNEFIDNGWFFGGQADAAAKAGDKGDAVGAEVVINDATIYQLTQSGLALQATVKGTKFWKDNKLN